MAWLAELAGLAGQLPRERQPRPYWSQRSGAPNDPRALLTLPAVAARFRKLVVRLEADRYLARALGYDCVDGLGGELTTIADQLEDRVGKPALWDTPTDAWSLDDLCDAIEVIHDLVARPTVEWYHDYCDCGWHPTKASIPSGRRLYTWQVNQLLEASELQLRLADAGEDAGRMVELAPTPLEPLVEEVLETRTEPGDEVAHAIAMFRRRGADRNDKRLAILGLARVLEQRRPFIKDVLQSKDEGALFSLANQYDLRHNNSKQSPGYGDEFLSWIFYYYLATVQLTDDLRSRTIPTDDPR